MTRPSTKTWSPRSTSDFHVGERVLAHLGQAEHHLQPGADALLERGEGELAGVADEDHPAGDADDVLGLLARSRGGPTARGPRAACGCGRPRRGRPACRPRAGGRACRGGSASARAGRPRGRRRAASEAAVSGVWLTRKGYRPAYSRPYAGEAAAGRLDRAAPGAARRAQPVCRPAGRTSGRSPSRPWPRCWSEGLDLGPATILVGENGSGKSTLVEAIAMAYGLSREGGSTGARHTTRASGVQRCTRTCAWCGAAGASRWGYFLRAETMHGLFSYLEDNPGKAAGTRSPTSTGSATASRSSACCRPGRFAGDGLFVMDEPEAGLSFTAQLALVGTLAPARRAARDAGAARHPLADPRQPARRPDAPARRRRHPRDGLGGPRRRRPPAPVPGGPEPLPAPPASTELPGKRNCRTSGRFDLRGRRRAVDEVEGDVEDRRGVRQPADAEEVDPGRGVVARRPRGSARPWPRSRPARRSARTASTVSRSRSTDMLSHNRNRAPASYGLQRLGRGRHLDLHGDVGEAPATAVVGRRSASPRRACGCP